MSLSETQHCLYQRTNQDCRIYHSGQFPLLVAKRHIRSFLVMRDRRIDPKLVLPSLIPCKSFLCAFRYVLLVITFRSPESQSGQRRPGGCKGKNGRRPNSETFPILRERDLRSEMTEHRYIIRGWSNRVDCGSVALDISMCYSCAERYPGSRRMPDVRGLASKHRKTKRTRSRRHSRRARAVMRDETLESGPF
jgi:hypothetical protein